MWDASVTLPGGSPSADQGLYPPVYQIGYENNHVQYSDTYCDVRITRWGYSRGPFLEAKPTVLEAMAVRERMMKGLELS